MTNTNCGLAVCRLIGNLINDNKNTLPQPLPEITDMADFAEKHNMLPMLYSALMQCGYFGNELSKFAEKADCDSFYQIKIDSMAAKISAKFTENQIPHIILKGIEYHRYYPSDLIRKTSDIDYYLAEEYSEKAQNILLSLGFEQKCAFDNSLNFAKKPCYHIEIHSRFNYKSEKQKQIMSEILDKCESVNDYRKRLTATNDLVYALMHLYKHIAKCGAGVRMLLDIYLIQKSPAINRTELDNKIKELDMEKFYSAINSIADYLFECKPIDENLKNAVGFILNCSTFGDEATYHRISIMKSNKKLNVIKHFSNEFGFSAENIKNKYPSARKHPITIPYFQIHRVVSGLIHKKSSVSSAAIRYKTVKDKESINRMQSVMDSLGIEQN